jgi:hypothetical protein
VYDDVKAVVDACAPVPVKVILESALLDDAELVASAVIACEVRPLPLPLSRAHELTGAGGRGVDQDVDGVLNGWRDARRGRAHARRRRAPWCQSEGERRDRDARGRAKDGGGGRGADRREPDRADPAGRGRGDEHGRRGGHGLLSATLHLPTLCVFLLAEEGGEGRKGEAHRRS